MRINVTIWKELTKGERMVVLEFAAWENAKRWKK